LPDPGEQVPTLSWPIVGIFTFALALFGASTWAALTDTLPAIATIAASAAAIFVLFTVCTTRRITRSAHIVGSTLPSVAWQCSSSRLISFRSFSRSFILSTTATPMTGSHPDHFVSAAPWWQLPVRFPAMDLPYIGLLVRNLRGRPRGEILETAALMTLSVTVIDVGRLRRRSGRSR
jgi:ring-1,2-phenylacetyl-CoA epoxidase subunit PaaE